MRIERLFGLAAALALSACATIPPAPETLRAEVPPAPPAPDAAEVATVATPREAAELQIACAPRPSIARWEEHYRSRPAEWLPHLDGAERGARYLPYIRRQLDEQRMPVELALLPTLESGFRNEAVGPRGSRGIWQLSAPTARRWGLVVDGSRDDRMHADLATRAALRHLRYLYGRYRDWPLALAAYNAGEARVDRALKLNPGASYWDLARRGSLPAVTCAYVPRLLGLARASSDAGCPDDLGDGLP